SPYKGYWSSSCPNKKKGSGVGVLIAKNIHKYTGNIKKHNEYLLEFHIILKHSKLAVLIVYLPPNDEKQVKLIQQQIEEIYLNRAVNYE
ncbi:1689_t:CDS:1, partial [Dentiscutata erythropus]